MLGRGPARLIASSKLHGPARPGPVHHFYTILGAARLGPSYFQKLSARPGPARPITIFQIDPARSGLDHRPMTSPEKNTSSTYRHVYLLVRDNTWWAGP